LFRNISPSTDNWLSAGTGVSGIHYQIIIKKDSVAIQLLISKDKAGKLNKKIFDFLYERKEEIEGVFGGKII